MSAVVPGALVLAAVNALAAAVGGLRWWQVEPSRLFWLLARAGQAASVLYALLAGVAFLEGFTPDDDLFWIYALLPVLVGFFAEQIRLSSASLVLEKRGLEDAQAVGRLPEPDQRSVVLAIVRREMGIVAAAAAVVVFLALRAAMTA